MKKKSFLSKILSVFKSKDKTLELYPTTKGWIHINETAEFNGHCFRLKPSYVESKFFLERLKKVQDAIEIDMRLRGDL